MDFLCINVETANESAGSICQVAIAGFNGGEYQPDQDFERLVDPEEEFSHYMSPSGFLRASDVAGKPSFPLVYEEVEPFLRSKHVLTFGSYTRVSLTKAAAKYGLRPIRCEWLDVLFVVRRSWPEFRYANYRSLHEVASHCGWEGPAGLIGDVYDARACGEVYLRACAKQGLSFEDWRDQIKHEHGRIKHQDGNEAGHLRGEVVVFTGSLSMPRPKMTELAQEAGCAVDADVTKRTTLVVVGLQDMNRLAGNDVSARHEKARALIAKGKPLRILGEADFFEMLYPDGTLSTLTRRPRKPPTAAGSAGAPPSFPQ